MPLPRGDGQAKHRRTSNGHEEGRRSLGTSSPSEFIRKVQRIVEAGERAMATPAAKAAAICSPGVPWALIMSAQVNRMTSLNADLAPPFRLTPCFQRANVVVHPLHAAASSGLVPPSDCPKLVAEPAPGFRCELPDSLGMSPLHWASLLGRSEWVAALIQCGADPDVLSPSRVTPVHYAAREGHVQATEALLAHKASVDRQDVLGASPLVSAVAGGHVGVVRVLCAAGADLELRTSTGKTALLVALGSCDVEMALALLEAGARTDQRSHPHGLTPLHMAAQDGQEEMVRALCSRGAGSSIELREANNGFTPLVSAIARGHIGVALALLEHGASAESRTAMREFPGLRSPRLTAACRGWGDTRGHELPSGSAVARLWCDCLRRDSSSNCSRILALTARVFLAATPV